MHVAHRYHRAAAWSFLAPKCPPPQIGEAHAAHFPYQKTIASTRDSASPAPTPAHTTLGSHQDCCTRSTTQFLGSVCPYQISPRFFRFPESSPHRVPSPWSAQGSPPPRISFVPRRLLFLSSTSAETQIPQGNHPRQPGALHPGPNPAARALLRYFQFASDPGFPTRSNSVFPPSPESCICHPLGPPTP